MSLKLMSIEQSDRVDIISIDPSTGNVVLTVNDPLHLKDSLAHQVLLQRKLNYYFAFVNSGELLEKYRPAEGKPVVFRVVFKVPPDEGVRQFLADTKSMLEPLGLTLEYEVLSRKN
jgi:hypothetical protein